MNRTHGMKHTLVYRRWKLMKNRCLNQHDKEWLRYGGRGIRICEDWIKFEGFFASVGHPPSPQHWLDRIDPNGNYEPGNVRWATMHEQARTKRSTRHLTYNGETMVMKDWAHRLGINYATLFSRLKKEPVEQALQGPSGRHVRPAYLKALEAKTNQGLLGR